MANAVPDKDFNGTIEGQKEETKVESCTGTGPIDSTVASKAESKPATIAADCGANPIDAQKSEAEIETKPQESKVESNPVKDADSVDDVQLESEEEDNGSLADEEIVRNRRERFALGKDYYCFQCHKDRVHVACSCCPRSYHYKCLPSGSQVRKGMPVDTWECPECIGALEGEEERKHSPTLSRISEEEFSQLLRFALGTVKQTAEPSFYHPVADGAFPDYKDFIIHPMDFQTIDRNIRKHVYKSTAGFLSDVKWIIHNCYIYNSPSHTLTKNANYFWKVAKNEMVEIEVCPDCFHNFYVYPKSWFIELCEKPHSLAYARLKGHPHWPCKVVRVDLKKQEADCRFFGAHDRAWVSFENVIQLSEEYPLTKPKAHKNKLDSALAELKVHIKKIVSKHPGIVIYSEPKTPFNPHRTCLTDPIGTTVGGTTPSKSTAILARSGSESSSSGGRKSTAASVSKKSNKRGPGRPPGAKVSTSLIVGPENDDEAVSTESEEAPLVIDAPPPSGTVSSSSRKRVSTVTKQCGRKSGEVEKVGTGVASTKRSRLQLVSETSSRSASIDTVPVSVVEESLPLPPSRRGRPSSGAIPASSKSVGSASRVKAKVSSMGPKAEPESDRKTMEEIDQLKKEVAQLQRQLQEDRESHAQEMKSIRETILTEVTLRKSDGKNSTDSESGRTLSDHFKKVIEDTKRQQWCAACLGKAIYFCCWNTSYCGYDCQTKHWPQHMNLCQQYHKRGSEPSTSSHSSNATSGHSSGTTSGHSSGTTSSHSSGTTGSSTMNNSHSTQQNRSSNTVAPQSSATNNTAGVPPPNSNAQSVVRNNNFTTASGNNQRFSNTEGNTHPAPDTDSHFTIASGAESSDLA